MQEELIVTRLFDNLKNKIKRHWILAFVSSMIIGFLTYGYFMSNHFLTNDSLWNMYSDQNMITSGRQFLQFACGLSSYYDLPWLNGILAIFFLSLTAVFVIEGFDIRSDINSVLVAGLIVTFPSITSTFGYTYTVDGYMLATLLSTIAFFLANKKKWGFIPAIILLGISLGIYQSYISFTIILCILRLLLDIVDKVDTRTIFIKGIRFVGMGIGSYIFYLMSLNLMLNMQNKQLSGYQGVNNIQGTSIDVLLEGLKTAFWNFVNFARWSNVLTTTEIMKLSCIILVLGGMVLFLYIFISNKCYKNVWNIVITLGCIMVIPFGATMINIISPWTFYHLLMRGCWCLFFVFVVALSERIKTSDFKIWNLFKKVLVIIVSVFSVVLIFEFSKMANIAGYNQNERYEKSYSLCVRLAEKLEQTPGYEHGMPMAILGGLPDYPSTDITKDDLNGYFGVNGDYVFGSAEHFAEFMSHYMNISLNVVDMDMQIKIMESDEFRNCPKFPDEGCVIKINDVWIVKLNG